MSNGLEQLQLAFKQLRLSEVSLELPALMREAEQKSWTYYELLNHLLDYELTKREEKNKARRLKWAKFPYEKTLEDYDLSEQTSLSERQMRQLK
ncbi:MAG TPA: ATP-binding protein, partial [Atopostipes sp.]|nr:ATP-binding protein [Atopostipes sp.]